MTVHTNREFDPFRPETVHPENTPVAESEIASETAKDSPEGAPAQPRLGAHRTAVITGVLIAAVLVVATLVGYFHSPMLGIATLVIVGLCAVIFNPVVWASAFRAGDSERGARRAMLGPGAAFRERSKRSRAGVSSKPTR